MKNSCKGVHDQTAIEAYIAGLPYGLLRHRLKREKIQDLGQMIQIASEYADGDDDNPEATAANLLLQSGKPAKP